MPSDVLVFTEPTECLLSCLGIKVFCLGMVLWIEVFFTALVGMAAEMAGINNYILFCYDAGFWGRVGSSCISDICMIVASVIVTNDSFFMG